MGHTRHLPRLWLASGSPEKAGVRVSLGPDAFPRPRHILGQRTKPWHASDGLPGLVCVNLFPNGKKTIPAPARAAFHADPQFSGSQYRSQLTAAAANGVTLDSGCAL